MIGVYQRHKKKGPSPPLSNLIFSNTSVKYSTVLRHVTTEKTNTPKPLKNLQNPYKQELSRTVIV